MAPDVFADLRSTFDTVVQVAWRDWSKLIGLRVDGVEVTQGIQYYDAHRHLTDSADRGPDNSVRLVAHKPAWVRVYLRSGLWNSTIASVAGTLKVERRTFGPIFTQVGTYSPEPPGTVDAQQSPDYATERGDTDSTLNFVIPADDFCGDLRLTVDTTAPGGHSAQRILTIDATLEQELRLRGILVGYNGPNAAGTANLNLAVPTVADLQATAPWTLTTYPISSTAQFSSGGSFTWSQPLNDAASCDGCCSPNWVSLNAQVAAARTADGNQAGFVYYGLLVPGIPMGPIVGCESSGVGSGSVNAQVTMAHEIGHNLGLAHGPCGTNSGDPSYPAYEPHDPVNTPMASIGEYGLNINTGTVLPPQTKDYMSYCGPRWMSLYHHGRLVNHTTLHPSRVCTWSIEWREWLFYDPPLFRIPPLPDPPPEFPKIPIQRVYPMDSEPLIAITGTFDPVAGELTVIKVQRVDAVPTLEGELSGMVAELVGDDGETMSRAPLRLLPSAASATSSCEDCGAQHATVVQAFLSDTGAGVALRVVRGDDEVWRRDAPSRRPEIGDFTVEASKEGLRAGWEVAAEGDVEFGLRWSRTPEGPWNSLAFGLTERSATFPSNEVPGGELYLQLIAHDGFFSTTSQPVGVVVEGTDLVIAILHPTDGLPVRAGRPLRLWAAISTRSGEPIDEAEVTWLIDGEEAGSGVDFYTTAPDRGDHEVTLRVRTDTGAVEAQARFTSHAEGG